LSRKTRPDSHQSVASILPRVINRLGLRAQLDDHQVVARWPELVGDRIAAHTTPSKLKDGILYVEVSSPVWIQELTMMKPLLLKRLRRDADKSMVKDLVFRNRGATS